MKVSNVRELLISKYNNGEIRNDTVELQGVSFEADEESIFGTVNQEYIKAEIMWYTTRSRNVNTLFNIYGKKVDIWSNICSNEGLINSNYGWCVYSEENGCQYRAVVEELSHNPNSRRAIMIYTRPEIQTEFQEDGMNDFICTNTVQYFNNNGTLDAVVNMRSNDAVFGYKNDRAWQQHVLKDMCIELDLKIGKIIWQCGSLHVYSRHFKFLEV